LCSIEIARGGLRAGINVADLLNRMSVAASKSEALPLIRDGGARLNDSCIDDAQAPPPGSGASCSPLAFRVVIEGW
jgi:hypothetical protein